MPLKLQNKNPMSNADFLLTIEGIPGYWTEFSGIKFTIKRPTYADPIAGQVVKASSGTLEYENVTIMRPFDPESKEDEEALAFIDKARCSKEPFTMGIRPVYRCEGIEFRGSKAWFFTGCKVEGHTLLDGLNIESADSTVKIGMEISYTRYERR